MATLIINDDSLKIVLASLDVMYMYMYRLNFSPLFSTVHEMN